MDIQRIVSNVMSGKFIENFSNMTSNKKAETILKTLAIAAVAGLISGLVIHGGVVPVFFIAAGVGAFLYFTATHGNWAKTKDHLNGIRNQFAKIRDEVME